MVRKSPSVETFPYKMKDLCDRTGLPRQAVHFYIQQGLVPEGNKTGKNMARYGEQHVERILLIKRLQNEQFLPLKAIKAVLVEKGEGFSPAQRKLLEDVKRRLKGSLSQNKQAEDTVESHELTQRAHVEDRDLSELAEVGLIAMRSHGKHNVVAQRDAWLVDLWGRIRAVGFTRELGFAPRMLLMFEEAIGELFEREIALLNETLSEIPGERVAEMLSQVMPMIGELLTGLHEQKVRTFVATSD
jgi:DNA-binding transcriptional MerR regulator